MEKKKYESSRKARNKWNKNNSRTYGVKCYRKTDADIIEYMDKIENRSAYIKSLILKDMEERSAARQESDQDMEKSDNADLPG